MTDLEKERIEKEAYEYEEKCGEPCDIESYIAGATSEHELLKPQLEYADNYIQMVTEDRDKLAELLKKKAERIAELLEALEAVIRLKPLIDYPNNTKEKHIGEAMAISGMLHKVETAIAKGKHYF